LMSFCCALSSAWMSRRMSDCWALVMVETEAAAAGSARTVRGGGVGAEGREVVGELEAGGEKWEEGGTEGTWVCWVAAA
jgi:hypothetical protein